MKESKMVAATTTATTTMARAKIVSRRVRCLCYATRKNFLSQKPETPKSFAPCAKILPAKPLRKGVLEFQCCFQRRILDGNGLLLCLAPAKYKGRLANESTSPGRFSSNPTHIRSEYSAKVVRLLVCHSIHVALRQQPRLILNAATQ